MKIPESLIESLHGIKDFDEAAFKEVHENVQPVTSIRLNAAKIFDISLLETWKDLQPEPIPWTSKGFYLSNRPSFTFDPLFHAGTYYVQEASSMFLEQAIKQAIDFTKPLKVLDLCAAPGGKSTHLQSLISKDSLLVSNEVIRQRVNILKDNIIKWGCSNVVVTNNDPKDFANLKGFFDVVVVDAPCSGSGLFRRDEEAISEWSENNVMLCSQRQQRILADVLPALKEDGILVYATCSFSPLEDEQIMDWLCEQFSLQNIRLTLEQNWMITETQSTGKNYGYRFWPHQVKGEGFFISVFQNKNSTAQKIKTKFSTKTVTKQITPVVSSWARLEGLELVNINNRIYAWPMALMNEIDSVVQNLRSIYSGTLLGEVMHHKLVPEHALAMSNLVGSNIAKTNLTLDAAITFLRKENIQIETQKNGWQIAGFNNQNLGWMNVLPNRINNYYPRELRILKK